MAPSMPTTNKITRCAHCIHSLYLQSADPAMTTSSTINYSNLSPEQRILAIQRLTALWAFCESGLGGLMHALQIPFTGLVVGGLAIIIITFIARLSDHHYSRILECLPIVLIVKAMVSPYTPFPAYIAVSFQAIAGIVLFSLLRVNLLSILLLAVITMLESAFQQILILTLFFGHSLWKAADDMVNFIAAQLGASVTGGSQWLVVAYLLIYIIAGILIAFMAYRITSNFFKENKNAGDMPEEGLILNTDLPGIPERKSFRKKLWILVSFMLLLSALLFLFAANAKQGWLAVIKTLSWTLTAILAWYMLISPVVTKLILKLLHKKQNRYSESINKTMEFLPVLRQLTALAWQKSKFCKGGKRMQYFFSTLLRWSLLYSDISGTEKTNKPLL